MIKRAGAIVLVEGQQVRCPSSARPLAVYEVVRLDGDYVWAKRNGVTRCYHRRQLRPVD